MTTLQDQKIKGQGHAACFATWMQWQGRKSVTSSRIDFKLHDNFLSCKQCSTWWRSKSLGHISRKWKYHRNAKLAIASLQTSSYGALFLLDILWNFSEPFGYKIFCIWHHWRKTMAALYVDGIHYRQTECTDTKIDRRQTLQGIVKVVKHFLHKIAYFDRST